MAKPFLAAVDYPDSDGQPMSDNTLQWDTIAYLIEMIRYWYRDRTDVFVAGNLLWYYEEGNNKARIGPDCLVSFGRPPGYRGSYKQWEEDGICPQVVWEVLSPKNTKAEMKRKYELYARLGCQEYYLIDPYKLKVSGFNRVVNDVVEIADAVGFRSSHLQLTLGFRNEVFELVEDDGTPIPQILEMFERRDAAKREADHAKEQADQAKQQADQAKQELAALRAKLIAAGIDPDA